MYDAFSKEYGTAELMAKDFGDATYSIFLALPTLAGSQFAIDEQVRLNQKNEKINALFSLAALSPATAQETE